MQLVPIFVKSGVVRNLTLGCFCLFLHDRSLDLFFDFEACERGNNKKKECSFL